MSPGSHKEQTTQNFFNANHLNLQIKRDPDGIPLPVPLQDLQNIHIEGLSPFIFKMEPATMQNLPLLMGMVPKQQPQLSRIE